MSNFYNNNLNLKAVGVPVQYTEDQLKEYIKCKNDPIYFIENYCKIISLDLGLVPFKLYDYQKRFVLSMHENNRVIAKMFRQGGKTQTVAAYLLYYSSFNDNKTIAILANKAAASREILSRFQSMFERLPEFLQQGVKVYNKGNIELENGSIVFTGATSSSGIRGRSCVTGETKICIEDNDNIYYTEIIKLINNRELIKIKEKTMIYTIYKTTNKINNKIYVGYHQIPEEFILSEFSEIGSIYDDGYLGSGSIFKKAIIKYGPEAFSQELLGIFNTKEEAENYESSVVDVEFSLRKDTYNIAIGGNVRIMYGENNGFYNKHHSEKVKLQTSIRSKNNKYYSLANNFKIRNVETNVTYLDYIEAAKSESSIKSKFVLINLIGEGKFEFLDIDRQNQAIALFDTRLSKEEKSKLLSDCAKERFSNVPKSEEHKNKIGLGQIEWIKNNPEDHKIRMEKINKNPEKIRKTAEKHTGMKRTAETCKNISESLKGKPSGIKGKIAAKNIETGKLKYFDSINDIPVGWNRDLKKGSTGKKSYTDGTSYKLYIPSTEPDGWYLGGSPNKK